MVTQPAPPVTWHSGNFVRSEVLRADVSRNVAFMTGRPLFYGAYNAAGYACTGTHGINMGIEFYDNWNGHSPTTSASGYFCQMPGWYLCKLLIGYNYTSATNEEFGAGFNGLSGGSSFGFNYGALQSNGSTIPLASQCTDLILQTVTGPIGGSGDFIQFLTVNNSGGSVGIIQNTAFFPYTTVRWVAADVTVPPSPLPGAPALAAWPVPPSFVTSSFLNTNIRDTAEFLLSPPILRAFQSGSHTLAAQTFPAGTAVPLNNVTVDNYSGFNTGTGVYTAPVAGNYFVHGQLNFNAIVSGGNYGLGFQVNSGTIQWCGHWGRTAETLGGGVDGQVRLRLNANDTVTMYATQSTLSTATYSVASGATTRMIIVWEGL